MNRLIQAVTLPLIVFPVGAVLAIAVGLSLLAVAEIGRLLATFVALGLVIGTTAVAFFADRHAGPASS